MIAQQDPGAKVEMNADKYVDEKLLEELKREGCFKETAAKAEHGRYSSFSLDGKNPLHLSRRNLTHALHPTLQKEALWPF